MTVVPTVLYPLHILIDFSVLTDIFFGKHKRSFVEIKQTNTCTPVTLMWRKWPVAQMTLRLNPRVKCWGTGPEAAYVMLGNARKHNYRRERPGPQRVWCSLREEPGFVGWNNATVEHVCSNFWNLKTYADISTYYMSLRCCIRKILLNKTLLLRN